MQCLSIVSHVNHADFQPGFDKSITVGSIGPSKDNLKTNFLDSLHVCSLAHCQAGVEGHSKVFRYASFEELIYKFSLDN